MERDSHALLVDSSMYRRFIRRQVSGKVIRSILVVLGDVHQTQAAHGQQGIL
jgi:hypothetical protein